MVRKEFIPAVGICLIAMLFAGCEEQNLATVKKSKLIAYENSQLKEQLAQQGKKIEEQTARQEKKIQEQVAQREKKIEEQTAQQEKKIQERVAQREKEIQERLAQREKKIEEQNGLLRECQQRREVLEKRFEEAINVRISEEMGIFKEVTEQMEKENGELKAQISKLEQQLKDINSPAEPRSLAP
jgi:flagellar biosynthesis GTPase FlhF